MVVLISNINLWWQSLSSAHQVFWFIAVVFSVLFFIQFILILIGMDSDGGDFEEPSKMDSFAHDFSALSVKSIIAFFTFFGWTGVLALNNQLNVWMAVILSSVAGIAAMLIVAYMIYKFAQLEQSGTLNLFNALDKPGEVYLTIPEEGKGTGRVTILVDGKIRELDAITQGDALKTGTQIRVVEILDGNVLKVESIPLPQLESK